MDVLSACFRYWGKADPEYPREPKWHTFVYHSLDVAAVASAFWACSPSVRRAFRTAIEAISDEALRVWILFFVALHDIGKLHALFQIKSAETMKAIWPGIQLGNIRPRPNDHGRNGFVQMDEVGDWIGTDQRKSVIAFRDWLAAVAGHHGSICQPNPSDLVRGYAAEDIRSHDVFARREWVEETVRLFLTPVGLSLGDALPKCSVAARSLLAGFCSLCDWIGSNTDLFEYQEPSKAPMEYLRWAEDHLARENALERFGLRASVLSYQGITALLKGDEHPRGVQTLVDGTPEARWLDPRRGPDRQR
jgi:CRISPR-associated endonuclease/helicase Cas3